ncbi:TPA: hypothetical protein ACY17N_004665 [Pseudomonas aeruginosa]|jgi:HPt (histidine-containing phosphotransfer) domain-containing protein|uniref:hypothetical protein n=1 Tax=Pseudomonas aeruginosa TaxID=287 RepID=UPI001A288BA4|nr:hypothetical protein [Pseudomonas aeruginosa]MBH9298109.1 hypothetical protein [Pseudomonas aeruginosa]HCL3684471.1 hypothetical protein [Pseudomonas aeruginosa]HEJ1500559.1 hypothetical protein [Pseudomonas aeruginosa]
MNLTLEFWQLVSLLLGFLGSCAGAGKLLLGQIDQRLETRFKAMEEARQLSTLHWDERFAALLAQSREDGDAVRQLERDLMSLRAELPERYVRREDYIRGQTVIEAKLDSLALRMENIQLKGVRHES